MTDDTRPDPPPVAWRLLLAALALGLILVTVVVQATQSAVIPPLIVQAVLLVVGLVLLAVRPRLGAIVLAVLAVLALLVNLPFIAGDLSHPESVWSFVPAALAVLGGVVGLVALIGVLRRIDGGAAKAVGALSGVAVLGILAIAVASSDPEDDVKQDGDQGMFAEDFEFRPDEFTAAAGDVGVFIGNDDLVRHNFSIDDLDVDEELPSKAFVRIQLTDVAPGEYRYYCNIEGHEDMTGTMTVE